MPLTLTSEQILSLIAQMEIITGVKGDNPIPPTMGYGLYKGPVLSDNKAKRFTKNQICNCWESILIAGRNAKLGYTDEDIQIAGNKTIRSEHVIASYVFRNRRGIMFPEPKRRQGWGIPSGLVKAGDIVMWGAGKHAALFVGGENVAEFENKPHRKGLCKLNELDQELCTDIVMFSPLPSPGELSELKQSVAINDFSGFTAEKQEILRFTFFTP